jgi:pSer/pThr/pTyr-binding forkhead associated (FHA) protein
MANPNIQTQPTRSILVVEDARGSNIYKLKKGTYTIGRSSEADIRIVGKGCSRIHATLIQASDRNLGTTLYTLHDGDVRNQKTSANGTIVNGFPIEFHKLRNDDQILFGTDAKATYLIVPEDFIPAKDYHLQTLTTERTIKFTDQKVCYVSDTGSVVVTETREPDQPSNKQPGQQSSKQPSKQPSSKQPSSKQPGQQSGQTLDTVQFPAPKTSQ